MSRPRAPARVVTVPPLASGQRFVPDFGAQRQDIGSAVPASPGRRHAGPLGAPLGDEAELGHAVTPGRAGLLGIAGRADRIERLIAFPVATAVPADRVVLR